jgi:putative DNA primase/helicase
VLASTKEYREDMDVVGQWIAERCEVDLKASVPTGEAYFDYSQWAEDEVGWEFKKLTFRRNISDRGFPAEKGTHGRRMIRGLRLKSTAVTPTTQTAADVGEQTVGDDTLDKRIKNLMATPPRSGDAARL